MLYPRPMLSWPTDRSSEQRTLLFSPRAAKGTPWLILFRLAFMSSSAAVFDHKAFLAIAPDNPGIYRMLGAEGRVLYVGKAKSLKKRIASYFRPQGRHPKTTAMVARIQAIETIVTRSEGEALILEQNLIKDHRPPYNILLRDDKSYPFIFLSEGEWPRLTLHRGTRRKKGRYFGPYPRSRCCP